MKLTKILSLVACLLAPCCIAAQAPQFTIRDLGSLPNLPACNATAISPSGNYVAGYCAGQIGLNLVSGPVTHAFLYSNGVMKDLNASTQTTPFVTSVNDSGVVTGGYLSINTTDQTVSTSGFIYQNGALQSLPSQLQGVLPFAVNNAGQYVGSRLQAGNTSTNFFVNSTAFLGQLSGGTAVQLSVPAGGGAGVAFGINASGTVAGATVTQNAAAVNPLLWVKQAPQALPLLSGYLQAEADAINDSGVAVGQAFTLNFSVLVDSAATSHAVLFNNGSVTDLGVLSGDVSSEALSINNSGWVAGFSDASRPTSPLQLAAVLYAPQSHYHAFLYANGKMYNLNNLLINGAGWRLSFATQINTAGQIVGTGLYQDASGNTVQRGFLLTPYAINNIEGAGFSTPAVTSISPNGLFTIFGSQLASVSEGITQSNIVNNQLPTNLGATCVESGGVKWGLFYVSPGQINALAGQLPASGTVPVTVVTNCGTSNEVATTAVNVQVAAAAPEFLYFLESSNGQNPVAAIEGLTGTYIGTPGLIAGATFAPAHAGDILTAFGVGWGATTSADPIGTIASGAANLTNSYKLTLGGVPVHVDYAGLSPNFAGLYQLNFTVPAGLTAGNQALVLTVDGVSTSPTAYITVGN